MRVKGSVRKEARQLNPFEVFPTAERARAGATFVGSESTPLSSEYARPRAADADAGANKRTAMSRGPPDIGGLISCAQLRLAIPKRARNPHPLRRRRSLKVDNFTYQTSKEDLM